MIISNYRNSPQRSQASRSAPSRSYNSNNDSLRFMSYQNHHAAVQMQRVVRGHLIRRELWSFGGVLMVSRVAKIQRVYRGHKGRQVAAAVFHAYCHRCAARIQGMYRRWFCRRETHILRIERMTFYVVMIQRCFRGRLGRHLFNALKKRRRAHRAMIIQRYYRGYRGRCKYIGMRLRMMALLDSGLNYTVRLLAIVRKREIDIQKARNRESQRRLGRTVEKLGMADISGGKGGGESVSGHIMHSREILLLDSRMFSSNWHMLHQALCYLAVNKPQLAHDVCSQLLFRLQQQRSMFDIQSKIDHHLASPEENAALAAAQMKELTDLLVMQTYASYLFKTILLYMFSAVGPAKVVREEQLELVLYYIFKQQAQERERAKLVDTKRAEAEATRRAYIESLVNAPTGGRRGGRGQRVGVAGGVAVSSATVSAAQSVRQTGSFGAAVAPMLDDQEEGGSLDPDTGEPRPLTAEEVADAAALAKQKFIDSLVKTEEVPPRCPALTIREKKALFPSVYATTNTYSEFTNHHHHHSYHSHIEFRANRDSMHVHHTRHGIQGVKTLHVADHKHHHHHHHHHHHNHGSEGNTPRGLAAAFANVAPSHSDSSSGSSSSSYFSSSSSSSGSDEFDVDTDADFSDDEIEELQESVGNNAYIHFNNNHRADKVLPTRSYLKTMFVKKEQKKPKAKAKKGPRENRYAVPANIRVLKTEKPPESPQKPAGGLPFAPLNTTLTLKAAPQPGRNSSCYSLYRASYLDTYFEEMEFMYFVNAYHRDGYTSRNTALMGYSLLARLPPESFGQDAVVDKNFNVANEYLRHAAVMAGGNLKEKQEIKRRLVREKLLFKSAAGPSGFAKNSKRLLALSFGTVKGGSILSQDSSPKAVANAEQADDVAVAMEEATKISGLRVDTGPAVAGDGTGTSASVSETQPNTNTGLSPIPEAAAVDTKKEDRQLARARAVPTTVLLADPTFSTNKDIANGQRRIKKLFKYARQRMTQTTMEEQLLRIDMAENVFLKNHRVLGIERVPLPYHAIRSMIVYELIPRMRSQLTNHQVTEMLAFAQKLKTTMGRPKPVRAYGSPSVMGKYVLLEQWFTMDIAVVQAGDWVIVTKKQPHYIVTNVVEQLNKQGGEDSSLEGDFSLDEESLDFDDSPRAAEADGEELGVGAAADGDGILSPGKSQHQYWDELFQSTIRQTALEGIDVVPLVLQTRDVNRIKERLKNQLTAVLSRLHVQNARKRENEVERGGGRTKKGPKGKAGLKVNVTSSPPAPGSPVGAAPGSPVGAAEDTVEQERQIDRQLRNPWAGLSNYLLAHTKLFVAPRNQFSGLMNPFIAEEEAKLKKVDMAAVARAEAAAVPGGVSERRGAAVPAAIPRNIDPDAPPKSVASVASYELHRAYNECKVVKACLTELAHYRSERNESRIESYAASLIQRTYRGFIGRSMCRRLTKRMYSQIVQTNKLKARLAHMAEVRRRRLHCLALIQARIRGALWRMALLHLNQMATICQKYFRRLSAQIRVDKERKRRLLGPEVIEMCRRSVRLDDLFITLVVTRCGDNYRLFGNDQINNCIYEGHVYRAQVVDMLDAYNALFTGSSLADKQQRIQLWHHKRVVDLMVPQLRLTTYITAATKETNNLVKTSTSNLQLVLLGSTRGPGIQQKTGPGIESRVLQDQLPVIEKYNKIQQAKANLRSGNVKKSATMRLLAKETKAAAPQGTSKSTSVAASRAGTAGGMPK